jgi:Ca2+-transporting ATPase
LEVYDLSVSEAALTGESMTVSKQVAAVEESAVLADRLSLGFMGTTVIRGKATAVVCETGAHTQLGEIAGLLANVSRPQTPLQKSLEKFGKRIVLACLFVCVLVFLVGIIFDSAPAHVLFLVAVSLAVAAIPEGLPAITTISLALGTQRMATRHALVRHLPAVETLGCTEVICTDKTGTLTSNAMAVHRFWHAGEEWRVTGGAREIAGVFESTQPRKSPNTASGSMFAGTRALVWAAGTTQGARLQGEGDKREFLGDPTDLALLVFAVKGGFSSKEAKVVSEIPFSSERRMSTTIVEHDGKFTAYTRGAVERLLEGSTLIQTTNGERPITEEDKQEILTAQETFAADGMRILGLSMKRLPSEDREHAEEQMIFLGVVGLLDPPRAEVPPALEEARRAGIQIIMITGDHLSTAKSIAKELHLWTSDSDVAVTGAELDKKSDAELDEILPALRVVARATPANKLRIIEALSRNHKTAAMTGDGVNDAPAVRAAPIGIAMGKAGTDVTREAADLVLADDNFATIIAAVEEGRALYQNIRKFIFFLLSSNAGLVLAILLASFLGWPVLLTPIQILWINLITNGLPALALGADPPDPSQMTLPPRKPNSPLLSGSEYWQIMMVGFLFAVLGVFGFWWAALYAELGENYLAALYSGHIALDGFHKLSIENGQTMAFTVMSLGPIVHSFSCRSKLRSVFGMSLFQNMSLWGAAFAAISLQALALYVPFLQPLFRSPGLDMKELWLAFLLCLIPLFAVEVGKIFIRRELHLQRQGS